MIINFFYNVSNFAFAWRKYAEAVIRRVFERGNSSEKEEIIRFYGPERVKTVVEKDSLIN